ncbi:MarR family winged helix-turn-helix transcriptional regulator [Enterococcus sp. AZ192]|uniref:MarR family winged helix-turn-helix transcriptional regulator n=1 Tax=unclassified Enterococcus TaxID=2608891 RepID=UPI003D27F399
MNNDAILGKWIDRVYRQLLHVNKTKIKEFDISPADYNYFLTIEEYPGCTQNFLAKKRMVDKGLVARIVKTYTEKGYIIKKQSLQKKSSYNLFLSDSGKQLVIDMRKAIETTENYLEEQDGSKNFVDLIDHLKRISMYLEQQNNNYE